MKINKIFLIIIFLHSLQIFPSDFEEDIYEEGIYVTGTPRLDQPGTLDTEFNIPLRVLETYSSPSGDILAIGEKKAGGVIIVKFKPDGTVDTSFGNQGKIDLPKTTGTPPTQ